MINCFVISLPDCTDRRQSISQTMDELGISFSFMDAVDGRNGLDSAYENQVDRTTADQKWGFLSDAEFACALSHINVYRHMVAKRIPYALVLEDDACPLPDILKFLSGEYYSDADLTQLDLRYPTLVQRGWRRHLFGDYSSYLRMPLISAHGAAAYVISQRCATFLASNAVPVCQPADWPDCIEELIATRQFRCIHPPLVKHDPHYSLIGQSGRKSNKESRRFLGVYIPPFRRQVRSLRKIPYKLLAKRLVNED